MNYLQQAAYNFAMKFSGKPIASWMFNTAFGHPIPDSYDQVGARAYEKSILVATLIGKIMGTMGMAIPTVQKLSGDKYLDVPPSHPLMRLLNYPSYKSLSRFDLFSHTAGRLELEGNCFWYLKGSKNLPEAIEIIPARFMTIVANQDNGEITKYQYTPFNPGSNAGNSTDIHPDNVIHFRRWHPNNAYWGLSAMSAAMIEINADYAMANWNQNFFGPRNAIPNMAVEVAGTMPQKEYEQMIRDWTSRGGQNRETIFFRSGMGFNKISIHNIGLTPLELSFLEGRKLNRKMLFDLFGIHEGLVDKEASEASSITAERLYYSMIWEKLNMLAQTMTLELATFFAKNTGDLVIGFKDIRPVNEELLLKKREQDERILSINEMRAEYKNKEGVEWGIGPVSGGGSAYLQFFGGGANASTVDSTNGGAFNRGRMENNETKPTDTQAPSEAGRQARGVLDREPRETEPNRGKAIAIQNLQKHILKQVKAGTFDPAQVDVTAIPPLYAQEFTEAMQGVKAHADVLAAFDPIFKSLSEGVQSDWLIRRVNQMPAEHREITLAGAEEITTGFGFKDRAAGLLEIDEELWKAMAIPNTEL